MKFRDYKSRLDFYNKDAKLDRALPHIPLHMFSLFYESEIERADELDNKLEFTRHVAEYLWYEQKRPYFNLYPSIEKKLLELSGGIDLASLCLPFGAIEVRTSARTVLMSLIKTNLYFVVDFGEQFQMIGLNICSGKLGEIDQFGLCSEDSSIPLMTAKERHDLFFVAAGVCLLAKDNSIVSPVILNADRREDLTPERLAELATKAINRTGRVGFDVGRDIERMRATAHYRNGCFAKYYVGKDHECYPTNSELKLAPVIKWRCGAVVNKDNLPTVPTGFKDSELVK